MTQDSQITRALTTGPLLRRMLIGASINLIIISLFWFSAGHKDPTWTAFYLIKPFIIVPFAGAMGGLCYHVLDFLRKENNWNRAAIYILSFLIYFIGLWLGTVLGLAGTYWH